MYGSQHEKESTASNDLFAFFVGASRYHAPGARAWCNHRPGLGTLAVSGVWKTLPRTTVVAKTHEGAQAVPSWFWASIISNRRWTTVSTKRFASDHAVTQKHATAMTIEATRQIIASLDAGPSTSLITSLSRDIVVAATVC